MNEIERQQAILRYNLPYNFMGAIRGKELTTVIQCLEDHPWLVAHLEASGEFPLHDAASRFPEAIPALLRAGTTVDLRDQNDQTPLQHILAQTGNDAIPPTETVAALIQAGADVTVRDSKGATLLHYAVYIPGIDPDAVSADNVQRLLDRGADPTNRDDDGWTPLALAFQRTNIEAIRRLRRVGAPFAAGNNAPPSALHWAAIENDLDAAHTLLDAGADIEERNYAGETPLHTAAYSGHAEIVCFLLKRGADIDAIITTAEVPNEPGQTALHLAARHPEVTRLLLDAGSDYTLRGEDGRTPLEQVLFETGDTSVAHQYREHHIPVSQEMLDSALHSAAHSGTPELVAFLLDWGAGRKQETLQRAVRSAKCCFNTETITPLLQAGVQLSVNDAVLYGDLTSVQAALDRGGNPNERYVERESMTEVQYFGWLDLISEVADKSLMGYVSHPLFNAVSEEDIEKTRLLLDHGADPNFMAVEMDKTPLYVAVEKNNPALVALLLEYGANPIAPAGRWSSPRELAEYWEYEDCAALLRPVAKTANP